MEETWRGVNPGEITRLSSRCRGGSVVEISSAPSGKNESVMLSSYFASFRRMPSATDHTSGVREIARASSYRVMAKVSRSSQ